MVDLKETENQPEKQFFEEMDDARAGMLHLEGSGLHSQPMTPTREPGTSTLWFFAKKDSALVKKIAEGFDLTHFTVVGKDQDFHACARGRIRENADRKKIDDFWNPTVAAWYVDGKDDPNLTLLQLDLEDAEIWGSTDNSMRFGWEIAKANVVDETTPDVGVHVETRFH